MMPLATALEATAAACISPIAAAGSVVCISGGCTAGFRYDANSAGESVASNGRGSVVRMAMELAATVGALANQAIEPCPMRFSKLRFWLDSQFSPGPALSLAIPRHIEQPDAPTRKPACS